MCFAAEALGQDILVAPRQAIKGGKITEAACCSLMGVLLAKRVRNQGMQNLEKKTGIVSDSKRTQLDSSESTAYLGSLVLAFLSTSR